MCVPPAEPASFPQRDSTTRAGGGEACRAPPPAAASCCQQVWLQCGARRGRRAWAQGNPNYFFGDSEHTTFTSHNIRFRAVRSDYFLFLRTWSTPQRVRILKCVTPVRKSTQVMYKLSRLALLSHTNETNNRDKTVSTQLVCR